MLPPRPLPAPPLTTLTKHPRCPHATPTPGSEAARSPSSAAPPVAGAGPRGALARCGSAGQRRLFGQRGWVDVGQPGPHAPHCITSTGRRPRQHCSSNIIYS
ncbi:hypothetical protein E2C01_040277 [Portunus trituberculatus]|uniref:Uncharacterized protein n=1 Tax=Portunus trituberculatus TaxID=210409 RepID=A0A5B7FMJ9_PORTR|nr:hypothetical protein [Portunus trituberculatus]